jgi:hypothetical protein
MDHNRRRLCRSAGDYRRNLPAQLRQLLPLGANAL